MFLKKNGESEKSEAYLPHSPPEKKGKKRRTKILNNCTASTFIGHLPRSPL